MLSRRGRTPPPHFTAATCDVHAAAALKSRLRPRGRLHGRTDGQTDGASAGLHADHIPAPGLHPPAVSRVRATCSAISNSTFHPFQQHNRRARLDLVMCRSVWLRRRGDESILPLSHSRPTHSTPPRGRPSHKTQCKVCDPHDKSFIYTESSSQIKRETRQSCRLQTSQEGEDGGGGLHTRWEITAATSASLSPPIRFRTLQVLYRSCFSVREKKRLWV